MLGNSCVENVENILLWCDVWSCFLDILCCFNFDLDSWMVCFFVCQFDATCFLENIRVFLQVAIRVELPFWKRTAINLKNTSLEKEKKTIRSTLHYQFSRFQVLIFGCVCVYTFPMKLYNFPGYPGIPSAHHGNLNVYVAWSGPCPLDVFFRRPLKCQNNTGRFVLYHLGLYPPPTNSHHQESL